MSCKNYFNKINLKSNLPLSAFIKNLKGCFLLFYMKFKKAFYRLNNCLDTLTNGLYKFLITLS